MTVYFSDRPERISGHTPTEEFVSEWGVGKDNFQSNPPNPPKRGTVPDPLSDYMKAGRWNVDDALGPMVKAFKKEHHMK